ncbi:MAG TPA: family 10 glycosylhydrolase [Leptolyngbyaceae cyanobacterium M65_K2018_010]|nr:family 10 glycosylhydrolase [Leptolyngbyaceae cyanobacterium M65_K2018_010]
MSLSTPPTTSVHRHPAGRRPWWRSRLSQGLALAASVAGWGAVALPTASPALALNAYCQVTQAAATAKEDLRKAAFSGDQAALVEYQAVVRQQAEDLRQCRNRQWPKRQAVWVRLYPCDLQPGVLEAVMDRIVNLGYNEIYVEVFYGGQVLLPQADNPTVWPSVVQAPGYERRDLLAEAIEKGRQRGLQVDAWMFTLNFGYSYGLRSDREQVLALNGRGQSTYTYAKSGASSNPDEVFVDPYHPQAQADYARMLGAVLRRRPDNVLFDYVRYPRGVGANSVVDSVDDLWIYGQASRDALLQRAANRQGQELIRRYISRGYLLEADITDVRTLYPDEAEPLWQSRTPSPPLPADAKPPEPAALRPQLQAELWQLVVAHAVQGVVDFVKMAEQQAQRSGIRAGAVFFPEGNQTVGTGGYDSRLQFWDRFPTTMVWHPMAYAVCGNTGCILEGIRRVLSMAPTNAAPLVMPAIAGIWGQSTYNRPALETQMEAIRRALPDINAVSHFAYSWQDPEFDRVRKFCALNNSRP